MKLNQSTRVKWAAFGAAVAVTIGGGGLMSASASINSGERAVFVPIAPCRIMDTRTGTLNIGPRATPITAGETHTIQTVGAQGQCHLPADVTGLALNVTAVNPTVDSFLTVFPAGVGRPNASNLNFVAGQAPVPNAVNVDVPADGKISFYNNSGQVNVAADVVGYYADANFDDRYYTKTQIDQKVMFAIVNEDGTLRRGTAGVTSTPLAGGAFAGDFTVTFPRDINTCSVTASITGEADNKNPIPGMIGVNTTNTANLAYVQTLDKAGADVPRPFALQVVCP